MNDKNNDISFIKLKHMDDIEIVRGKNILNKFPMHLHRKYCIGIITCGHAALIHRCGRTELSKDFVYFINPGEAHQILPINEKGFDHLVFCFGNDFAGSFMNFEGKGTDTIFFQSVYSIREKISKRILSFLDIVFEDEREAEFVLMDIFSDLNPSFTVGNDAGDEQAPHMKKLCNYITENCVKNLMLEELASIAHLSKFHFSRAFKRAVGISPYDFQIQARIKLAKTMLLNSRSITETALNLGFTDQSHFSRFFKRDTGVSPAQFIKRNIKV